MGSTDKNKPWAVLRVSRKAYAAARPWKRAGMPRQEFESLILDLPDEFFAQLRDEADAERLAEAIFKDAAD